MRSDSKRPKKFVLPFLVTLYCRVLWSEHLLLFSSDRSTSEEEEDTPTKRMVPLEEDIGPEEIAKFLGSYQPRALRMIPFIH